MGATAAPAARTRLTFDFLVGRLRKRNFGVLSTVGEDGTPHSAGVVYGLARDPAEFVIYVMTRRHLRKARDIALNPSISLVIPLTRRLLWFVPPASVQLTGSAEILGRSDPRGVDAFAGFWMGRRILKMYDEFFRRGESRICFLRITPDPVISTYMLGHSVFELRNRMERGVEKIAIPPERRAKTVRPLTPQLR